MANITSRILWWALVVSVLIYVAVAYFVQIPQDPGFDASQLMPIFVAISAATAVGTIIFRRRALSDPIQARELDPSTPEGLAKAMTPYLVNLVLSESIGVYGLVLAFLSGEPLYSVCFSAAAIALLFVHRPTAPDLVPPMSPYRP